jgi:type II secretory pathway component PulK
MTLRHSSLPRRPGYVLVAVLLVVVVLSLSAYQFVEVMTSEYRASARSIDAAQVRACALSGLHYAAGILSDRDSFNTTLGGDPFSGSDKLGASGGVECRPAPDGNPKRRGLFALVAVVNTGTGGSYTYETRFGAVTDEGGKLNINALIAADPTGQVLHDALMLLPNMTEDVADAIVDWVDADDTPRTNGAESAVYMQKPNPYRAKNGPIHTIDELLLVQGVTPQLLYGTDRNRNGQPDDDPSGSQQVDSTFRGWVEYLTAYGRELNVDSTGTPRQYLNQASDSEDLPTLLARLGGALGPDLANYVLAYKLFGGTTISTTTTTTISGSTSSTGSSTGGGTTTAQLNVQTTTNTSNTQQGQVQATPDQLAQAVQTAIANGQTSKKQVAKSVLSLVNTRVTLPAQPAQPGQPAPPTYIYDCPLNNTANLASLLPVLMDKATATTVIELSPRVNINTASREVLMALPGVTDTIADAIIAGRPSPGSTDQATLTGAWVVANNVVPIATFQQMEPYVTGRTMVYRVQSIGYFAEGGPVARMEAVIDINQGAPRFLYFRDLTDLDNPRGFEPPRQ